MGRCRLDGSPVSIIGEVIHQLSPRFPNGKRPWPGMVGDRNGGKEKKREKKKREKRKMEKKKREKKKRK